MFKKFIKNLGDKLLEKLDIIRDFKEVDLDHKEIEEELLSNQKANDLNDIFDEARKNQIPDSELEISTPVSEEKQIISEQLETQEELMIKVNQKIIGDFLESYIGSVITKIKTYTKKGTPKATDGVFDIAEGKIISKIEMIDTRAKLYLTDLGHAKHSCILEIKYDLTGSFEESDELAEPTKGIVYRIQTYGGESLDYIDTNFKNTIKVII